MLFSTTILAVVSLALAAPQSPDSVAIEKVNVILYQDKSTSKIALSVMDELKTKVLGISCGKTLDSGSFSNHPITLEVDENGFGDIVVGSTTYLVHENPEISGGATCSQMYNGLESVVTCLIPVPAGLELSKLSARAEDCFGDLSSGGPFLYFMATRPTAEFISEDEIAENITARDLAHLEPRQRSCSETGTRTETSRVGDGNPHQNYLYKQLSQVINCAPNNGCSVGALNSKSYTITWSSDISAQWISGGYSVSKTWTTGNTYTCNAGPGQSACVWYETAHTAYTVKNRYYDSCGTLGYSNNFVMFSPNKDNRGGKDFYCVVGTCRKQGDGYWVKSGRPGGP